MRDQIASDRRSKCTLVDCVLCVPFIRSGSANKAGYIRAVYA